MFQTIEYNLIKTANYVLDKGYIFLITILIGYTVMVVQNYLILSAAHGVYLQAWI